MNLRFMFFDTEKKEWFKPSYKPLNDLLITGNGDVYHVNEDEDKKPSLKMATAIYKVAQYIGVRDENQNKFYTGSLLDMGNGTKGVLVYTPDGFFIDHDNELYKVTEKELKSEYKVSGHLFEIEKNG